MKYKNYLKNTISIVNMRYMNYNLNYKLGRSNMTEIISLIAYILGFGFLSYLILTAVGYFISVLKGEKSFTHKVKTTFTSSSRSTPNMLLSLDKQLHEINLQVFPDSLGNFDTGSIQSLFDNTVVGKYDFIKPDENGGVYKVLINDSNIGQFSNNYSVRENHNLTGIPTAISKMLEHEFENIAGRQANENEHIYFKRNGVAAAEGLKIARKRLVIEHNHIGDVKADSGRTFTVEKNDILIPIKNINGNFLSYLAVNKNNIKNVRIASSIKGGFFAIGAFPSKDKEYILCEDYLTGSTLHRIKNKTVLVCFDVQNIVDVARDILFKECESKFIFATAKDLLTKNQARVKKGLEYANEFDMPFIFPVFPNGKQYDQYKNWNELQEFKSDDEIRMMIDNQIRYFNQNGKDIAISQFKKKCNIVV